MGLVAKRASVAKDAARTGSRLSGMRSGAFNPHDFDLFITAPVSAKSVS